VTHKISLLGIPPVSSTTTQPTPDLTVAEIPNRGFCKRDNEDRLVVRVKNEGTAAAAISRSRIDFVNEGVVRFVETPAIPAGGFVDLLVDLPSTCHGAAQCAFTICTDSDNRIIERREDNNCMRAVCVG
jgi:subtilase family serine protease